MSTKPPRFAVGDTVCPRFHAGSSLPETGTVIERYDLAGQYRYVVKFEDGREEVFCGSTMDFRSPRSDFARSSNHVS